MKVSLDDLGSCFGKSGDYIDDCVDGDDDYEDAVTILVTAMKPH